MNVLTGDFTIVEHPSFRKSVRQVISASKADPKALNDVMRGVYWALSKKPTEFPILDDKKKIRIIKTNRVDRGLHSVPMLRIWFCINEEEEKVELLKMETLDLSL